MLAAEHWLVAGTVWSHEPRLDSGTTPVARIFAAPACHDPGAGDLASMTDCGWMPEYIYGM